MLSYYEGYWFMMKHYGGEYDNRMSMLLNKEENQMLQKTKKLRENALIVSMMVNIMLPLFILSLLSFIVPQIYTIIPVYETQTCWSYFN